MWSQAEKAVLSGLLGRLGPCLEILSLNQLYRLDYNEAIRLFTSAGCPRLRSLTLTSLERDVPDDALLEALARGAAPGLTYLEVEGLRCSDASVR